jgi:hypothetical protein
LRLRVGGTMTGPLQPPGFAPTGRRIEFETAEFSRFEGEPLVSHRVVLDMLALARQISAAPAPGSWLEGVNVAFQRLLAWISRRRRRSHSPPLVLLAISMTQPGASALSTEPRAAGHVAGASAQAHTSCLSAL